MASYEIDPQASSIGLRFSPGLPGMGARGTGLRGTFDAVIGDDGVVDWSSDVRGSFELAVTELSLGDSPGHRLATMGTRAWLDPSRYERITGEIDGIEPDGPDRFACSVTIAVKDLEVTMRSTGRFALVEGRPRATGRTVCDPRAFGVLVPPFLNLLVHVRWDVVLTEAR